MILFSGLSIFGIICLAVVAYLVDPRGARCPLPSDEVVWYLLDCDPSCNKVLRCRFISAKPFLGVGPTNLVLRVSMEPPVIERGAFGHFVDQISHVFGHWDVPR